MLKNGELDIHIQKLWNEEMMTGSEIARSLSQSISKTYQRISEMKRLGWDMDSRNELIEYTIYKGDDFIMSGTAKDVSKSMEVSIQTVYCWSSPSFHKNRPNGYLAYKF